eukprot:TRINITY_DN31422_c0_g6_i1.p1 TRINITY_DN31422_c0_g6~~TRINITY_DN31422_c0_g6_i1.p1  ORF type:complete len:471 (+),score=35.20 TRINITY_DN31422_c0_g6_i1:144-1556(+)
MSIIIFVVYVITSLLLGNCMNQLLQCDYEEVEEGCELDIDKCSLLSLLDEVAGVNTQIANSCQHRYLMSVQEPRNQSISDEEDRCYFHKCGASLIAPNLVLTAAHCIYSLVDEKLDGGVNNQFYVARAPQCRHHTGEGRYPVQRFWIYPDYDNFNLLHDIAVLQIDELLSGPYLNYDLPVDIQQVDNLSIVGWGDIDANETKLLQPYNSRQMRIARDLKIVPHSECQKKLRSVREFSFVFDNQMICAEGESVDACRGDSGGPLTYKQGGNEILVGITSWGPRDSQCITYQNVTRPGIYTRVSYYKDWIDSIVNLVKVTKESTNLNPNIDLELRQQVLQETIRSLGPGNDDVLSQQTNSVFSNQQQQVEGVLQNDDEIGQSIEVVLPPISLSPIQIQVGPEVGTQQSSVAQIPFVTVDDDLIDGIQIPFNIKIIDRRSTSQIRSPTKNEDILEGLMDFTEVKNVNNNNNNT